MPQTSSPKARLIARLGWHAAVLEAEVLEELVEHASYLAEHRAPLAELGERLLRARGALS